MAHAKITHKYADGSVTVPEVKVGESYPDSCAEAVASVLRMWREAVPDGEVAE